MTNVEHEKRIQKLEAECVEIRKQIMQLEFQHKKDLRESEKRSDIRRKEDEQRRKEDEQRRKEHEQSRKESEEQYKQWRKGIEKDFKFLSAHARHLSKLAGITFEEFGELDDRLEAASIPLSRKGKKSK